MTKALADYTLKSNLHPAARTSLRGTVQIFVTAAACFVLSAIAQSPSVEAATSHRLSKRSTLAPYCEAVFAPEPVALTDIRLGAHDYETADRIARELGRLSKKSREQTINRLFLSYRQLPKSMIIPNQAKRVAPRRLADRVLSLATRSDLQFSSLVDSGVSPRSAFAELINPIIEKVGGNYDADVIAGIVALFQSELIEKQKALNGYPLKFFIGGSFVNGKASLKDSDLDVSLNHGGLARSPQEWDRKLNEALRRTHPEAHLKVELHGEPAAFYGALNPFVFEITATGVRLHVFAPASRTSDRALLEARAYETYSWH